MSGIDIGQLKLLVIQPTLAILGQVNPRLASAAAVNLLAGTVLVESGGVYLKQLGTGPALGLWQMEPVTHDDIWGTFLVYNPALTTLVQSISGMGKPASTMLIGNLPYAAAMARLKYWRSPVVLPAANDAVGLATAWKQIYNSDLGAGSVDAAHVALFQSAIEA